MATLVESGRSKMDIEISHSSTNHQTAALSTAEFANSKQEPDVPSRKLNISPQGGEHFQFHYHQLQDQPESLCLHEVQKSWSTKLRSVPLSLDFDVSVFATQDRHGWLTLHPVLQTAEAAAALTASQHPILTSRAVTHSQTLRSGGGGGGGGEGSGGGGGGSSGGIGNNGLDGGDLGRNNCAKASFPATCPPPERNCNSRPQQQKQQQQQQQRQECLLVQCQQMADTDISTATRASYSVGAVAENSGVRWMISSTSTTPAAGTATKTGAKSSGNSRKQQAANSDTCTKSSLRRPVTCAHQPNGHCSGLSVDVANSYCNSRLRALSPVKVKLPKSSHRAASSPVNVTAVAAHRSKICHTFRQHKRQQHNFKGDNQTSLPKFTEISSQSDSISRSQQKLRSQLSRLSPRSMTRVVRKLESRRDSLRHRALVTATSASATATGTGTATDNVSASCENTSRCGSSCGCTRRTTEIPGNNLDLADLRKEYELLFRY